VSEAPSARIATNGTAHWSDFVPRLLGRLGRATRRRSSFALRVAALGLGVVLDAVRPNSWRRPVKSEFYRALRQTIVGGLATSVVTATLVGIGMVYQALYWLSEAGQEGLIGSVLVTALMRLIAPVLVGLIVLGRSGMLATAEIGVMQAGGQVHTLESQGLDPFLLLVLPRACAFALASFTLAVAFVVLALLSGFIFGQLVGALTISLGSLLDSVLAAMHAADFAVFPVKMFGIGILVALTACITGLEAERREDPARLLPRAFVRGVLAVLLASIALGLAV